ncbi:flagellar hook-length control protein FliK [Pseudotabrizicola algicola]|uniref:Flagellar hook-length control protein-like C-terminal domain-containing protein n=1 Tax=Pseudotabrizicola algicola TaxID=2709381 RepID=A0A6B3RND1_9RHOB|nr:flagellar hook-length control protein FliK [Pseudotabrizicola algicola]NEX46368.1 hypothetical protein [Pseudotabrizicola algicola]
MQVNLLPITIVAQPTVVTDVQDMSGSFAASLAALTVPTAPEIGTALIVTSAVEGKAPGPALPEGAVDDQSTIAQTFTPPEVDIEGVGLLETPLGGAQPLPAPPARPTLASIPQMSGAEQLSVEQTMEQSAAIFGILPQSEGVARVTNLTGPASRDENERPFVKLYIPSELADTPVDAILLPPSRTVRPAPNGLVMEPKAQPTGTPSLPSANASGNDRPAPPPLVPDSARPLDDAAKPAITPPPRSVALALAPLAFSPVAQKVERTPVDGERSLLTEVNPAPFSKVGPLPADPAQAASRPLLTGAERASAPPSERQGNGFPNGEVPMDTQAQAPVLVRDVPMPASPAPPTPTVVSSQALTPQISHVIAQSVATRPDGTVELMLRPEELGQLRFDFATNGERLTVVVYTERAEAMDLFRRHADHLLTELRLAGFAQASLSFGEWSQRGGRAAAPLSRADQLSETAVSQILPPSPPSQASVATGRLDLRL